jgi:hypothetical protein
MVQDIAKMKTAYGTALPVYCSSSFEWKSKKGYTEKSKLITVETEHMVGDYAGILIKSTKSGDVKYFEPVYDEDGYDGEFMVYRCRDMEVVIWNY